MCVVGALWVRCEITHPGGERRARHPGGDFRRHCQGIVKAVRRKENEVVWCSVVWEQLGGFVVEE